MFEVKDFELDVIKDSYNQPVLVDFWAEWCGPCKFIGPIVEKLAGEADGKWKLIKVNTEENQNLASEWGIRGIPNLKLFYKGEVIDEVAGAMAEPDMRKWLEEKLPSRAKSLQIEGAQLIEQGHIEEGVQKLEAALNEDSGLEKARILLAQQIIWNSPEEVQTLLQDISYLEQAREILLLAETMAQGEDDFTDGVSKEDVWLGIQAMKSKDFSTALDKLIRAIMIDKPYLDELARRLVIALFHYLGESHEITRKYRRQFDMALY
jgi:putative thioredoxin